MKNSSSNRNSGNVSSKKRGAESEVTGAGGSKVMASTVALNGKIKAELFQSDREAFLNAFEKPTQIYRYIRSRTIHSPIFLHRNLSYMKQRMSRTHKIRPNFRVDTMLQKALEKLEAEKKLSGKETAKNFYNIILLGLTDPDNNWIPDTKAKVEIQIARICVKKRKDVRIPINRAFEGLCEVKVQSVTNCTNPSPPTAPSNHNNNTIHNNNNNNNNNNNISFPLTSKLCPVISVPSDCFNLVNGHVVRSYVLMVRVSIPRSALVKGGGATESNTIIASASYAQSSSSTNNKTVLTSPQVSKKTASVTVRTTPPSHNTTTNHTNGMIQFTVNPSSWTANGLRNLKPEDFNPKVIIKQEDHVLTNSCSGTLSGGDEEPKPKRRRSAPSRDREQFIYTSIGGLGSGFGGSDDMVFMGQITIYDKQLSITLGTADYELLLRQCQKRRASFSLNRLVNQEASWEILESNHPKIQIFPSGGSSGSGRVKLNVAIRTSAVKSGPFIERPLSVLSASSANGCGPHVDKKPEDGAPTDPNTSHTKVIYQFLYNNNSRQQTEAREDLRCPWCSLNCLTLYSLLKHLKLCHPRFHFAYVPVPSGARIDVSINESFDGSYSGSAYDLVAQPPGEAFARNGPTKRTNIFSILVCRPQKVVPSLQEFLENEEKDVDHRKTFITGHNRLYHHTTTCLPIQPKEIDVDSEGEPDPEWLQIKTSMMIDEFTDVNEGEKELMKMWNLHVLKHNYVGDCQIPLACDKFVEYKGKDIIKKNLYRNFILHLTNLYDFGLLSPHHMYQTVQHLHGQMKDNNTAGSLRESWKAHLSLQASGSSVPLKPIKAQTLSDLSNLHITAAPVTISTSSTKTAENHTTENSLIV